MHTDLVLMPWHEKQWFAITNLALEASQQILQSCDAAYVLSTWGSGCAFPLCFSESVCFCFSHSQPHQNKPRPKMLQSCIVLPTNYKAMHAQPSFIRGKNNDKIENHSTHLENTLKQKEVN